MKSGGGGEGGGLKAGGVVVDGRKDRWMDGWTTAVSRALSSATAVFFKSGKDIVEKLDISSDGFCVTSEGRGGEGERDGHPLPPPLGGAPGSKTFLFKVLF